MRACVAACALTLTAPGALAAQEVLVPPPVPSGPSLLQQRDIQLTRIGWQLAKANAPFCADARPQIGLVLQDASTYTNPAAARARHRVSGDIWVQAVAPGSPAHDADLRFNAEITRIGEQAIGTDLPVTNPAWMRLPQLYAAIDALAAQGPVSLTWKTRGGEERTTLLEPVAACPSRFEVLSRGNGAAADGTRVIFGRDFAGFDYPEDEMAAAVAHELAHNLLRHPSTLKETGPKRSAVRLTERDADRLMPWLLANAGYDPHAAARFMRRWGPKHDGGLFRRRTHDGWDERVEAIEAEIALVETRLAEDGKADWSAHFVPLANGKPD